MAEFLSTLRYVFTTQYFHCWQSFVRFPVNPIRYARQARLGGLFDFHRDGVGFFRWLCGAFTQQTR